MQQCLSLPQLLGFPAWRPTNPSSVRVPHTGRAVCMSASAVPLRLSTCTCTFPTEITPLKTPQLGQRSKSCYADAETTPLPSL